MHPCSWGESAVTHTKARLASAAAQLFDSMGLWDHDLDTKTAHKGRPN